LELASRAEIYDQRPHIGGKVASWQDKDGNHIEMGLHVFFGCYFNLFRLMAKCGVLENLLLKDHAHTFINAGGDVRLLDFRFQVGDFKVGAPFHGLKAFFTTPQLSAEDKLKNALALGTSPVVRAVIDPEGGMRDVRALDDISFEDWFLSHGMMPMVTAAYAVCPRLRELKLIASPRCAFCRGEVGNAISNATWFGQEILASVNRALWNLSLRAACEPGVPSVAYQIIHKCRGCVNILDGCAARVQEDQSSL
jgi:hypothetical protein